MEEKSRFKKVYIEISNVCNLNCDFCHKTKREKKVLNEEEFIYILDKIKLYTKYLYFHVLGEPLLHPNINKFIDIARSKGFYVNITTNGYLISNIKSNNIRQVNISLHSFNNTYKKSLKDYLSDIYDFIINNSNHTYCNLRIWTNNENTLDIIDFLEKRFNKKIIINKHIKLAKNVFLDFDNEFIWPDENSDLVAKNMPCHALKDHIAILSNGVVTACCLDADGVINLGNIFSESIDDIMNKDTFKTMLEGFKNNQRVHPLCQKCNFIEIKNKK